MYAIGAEMRRGPTREGVVAADIDTGPPGCLVAMRRIRVLWWLQGNLRTTRLLWWL